MIWMAPLVPIIILCHPRHCQICLQSASGVYASCGVGIPRILVPIPCSCVVPAVAQSLFFSLLSHFLSMDLQFLDILGGLYVFPWPWKLMLCLFSLTAEWRGGLSSRLHLEGSHWRNCLSHMQEMLRAGVGGSVGIRSSQGTSLTLVEPSLGPE